MGNRWLILVGLFVVRTALGYQFQSVGSVSSFLVKDLGISYAQLGALIGFFDLPGVVLAFPGGLLGRRFGDKRVVLAALGLMTLGGLVMGVSDSYAVAAVGRLLSGVGAILLNVLLTKMVADWFTGREIVTAMAILVSSWPLGISLGLVSLGPLAAASSWRVVMHLTAAVCAAALVLVAVIYRAPPGIGKEPTTRWNEFRLSRWELGAVVLAGLIWALFNAGFAILPSFAPDFLASIGYTTAAAGSLVSVVTWLAIPSVQLGGYIADRLRRPTLIMTACFIGIGLAMVLLSYSAQRLALFTALGLLFGPPAGIIMALPAEVLRPENRAAGMGVFYTFSYGAGMLLSALAGLSRDLTQSAAAPLVFGGTLLFLSVLIVGLFRALQTRGVSMVSVQR